MEGFLASGCLLFLTVVAFTQAVVTPKSEHIYLGYISPFNFVKAFSENARPYVYHPYRNKRSSMQDNYNYNYNHNAFHPMPYSFGYGQNPMVYDPFRMFHHNMQFPTFSMPPMPSFPYYHSSRPAYNDHNNGYYASKPGHAYEPSHPFGDHFMRMMGFDFNKFPSVPVNADHSANNYNGGYDFGSVKHSASANGKNYETSYSKSYSMNMANGKGHMVTKDSSYVNNNGQVERHDNPEQHYTMNGEGKFVPVNGYNQQH